LVCDVDFFKQYNDTYGHQSGDDCLKTVAALLRSQLRRPADTVARYGGEEFAAVLPDTDLQGALLVAEGMRASVAAARISHAGSRVSSIVTVSIGVAALVPQVPDGRAAVLAGADWALYEAKRLGRNRIEIADPGLLVPANAALQKES
jgi:two-component system chemotaxis family response regulator WspR